MNHRAACGFDLAPPKTGVTAKAVIASKARKSSSVTANTTSPTTSFNLVLARLPDAPKGTRGISLFLAPKVLPDGTRNDVRCSSIEHKLGIHASPTCTMVFGDGDGAVGWLVGEEHRGLACMFTMMNRARLAVALQGVAIAERACQDAVAFAGERRQKITNPQRQRQCAHHSSPVPAAYAVDYAQPYQRRMCDLLCHRRRNRPLAPLRGAR
jgi:alkylation response protein AidB-like acyl-CoA dehydrogenase